MKNEDQVATKLNGEIRFLHDGKIGPSIYISVKNLAARDELLRKLCSDPEVEGFEATWEPSERCQPCQIQTK